MKKRTCIFCDFVGEPNVKPGSGPHAAKMICPRCGRFINWLSKKEAAFIDVPGPVQPPKQMNIFGGGDRK